MSTAHAEVVYPESDGKPMADNMTQGRIIRRLCCNMEALVAADPLAFVAGDNFWYPVEGEPLIRQAPDVYVVFGRPKGDRGSYLQWKEDDIPIQIVFEILSPSNTEQEMIDNQEFYRDYGAEEYYVFDPDRGTLDIFLRHGSEFRRQRPATYTSPRLGFRLAVVDGELVGYRPDGRRFLTFEELDAERQQAEHRAEQAEAQRQQAEAQRQLAEGRASASETLNARLRELSRKARRGTATADELAELDRLEEGTP